MLPSPHGPSDGALPDAAPDVAVDEGRTPDEGALQRVVEHLADVPDGDDDEPTEDDDTVDRTDEPTTAEEAHVTPMPDEAETARTDPEQPAAVAATDAAETDATETETVEAVDETETVEAVDETAAVDASDPQDAGDDATEPPAADATTDLADAGTEDDDVAPEADEAPAATDADAPATDAAAPDADAAAPDAPDADAAVADAAAPDAPAADPTPPGPVEVGPVAAALSDTRHRIDELNAAERLFVGQQRSLVAGLCPDPSDAVAVGALFDRVHAQWLEETDRPDLQPLADAFGVVLGDLLCVRLPALAWAAFTDRYGTEIVLAHQDPEVVVYPIAAVAQSWPSAGPGWFVKHLETVAQSLAPLLQAADV